MNYELKSKIESFLDSENAALSVFLFWPFVGFLIAIRNFSLKYSKSVILAFFVLYGFTIINDQLGFDLYTNSLAFQEFVARPNYYFFEFFSNLFKEDGNLDLLQRLISFGVSRFTSNVSYLFAVYSFIFGFLYIKGISILHKTHVNSSFSYLFFIFFLSFYSITSLGNFRFFSAVWIFFIGAYYVLYLNHYKYLIICFLSMTMHFSLGVANLLLISYLIIGNKNIVYFVLVFLSFIIPQFSGGYIVNLSYMLGGGFEKKAEMYMNEDYVYMIQNQSYAWFLIARTKLLDIYFYLMLVISYVSSIKINKEKSANLFSFSLLLLAFSNFVIDIPSLGGRYKGIFHLFSVTFFYFYFRNNMNVKNNLYFFIGLIPLIFQLAITFRFAADTINIWIFTPNPLPFMMDGHSLWSVIDNLL